MKPIFKILAGAALIAACNPYEDVGIELPGGPSAAFDHAFVENADGTIDSNRVVVTSLAADGFLHFWDFGNGRTSSLASDTAYYPQAGTYEISYNVYNAGGSDEASVEVTIENTLELPCEGTLALLTGCDNQKTWYWSQVAGAISVGPTPYATEWYASPAGGLVDEQYDDTYKFTFDGAYIYDNNGGTVNPFEGYVVSALEVPELTWYLSEGTGTSGEDQIILPACWFMGVWDSGPAYDIVELTENSLILHGKIQNGDCSAGDGYFTLSFSAP
jgi:PKD repeat protein